MHERRMEERPSVAGTVEMKKFITSLLLIITSLIIGSFIFSPHIVLADNYYIGNWAWNSSLLQWEAPHQDVVTGALDLRSNTAAGTPGPIASGFGLFSYSAPVADASLTSLGSDLGATMSGANRSSLGALFGVSISIGVNSYRDFIWQLLTVSADPTGVNAVKPLMPDRGSLNVTIGGHLIASKKLVPFRSPEWANIIKVIQLDYARVREEDLKTGSDHYKKFLGYWMKDLGIKDHRVFLAKGIPDEGWSKPASAYWENFNCPDNSADVSCQQSSWPVMGGTWKLASKKVQMVLGTNVISTARCTTNLSGADMLASVYLDSPTQRTNATSRAGVALRFSVNAATTCYVVGFQSSNTGLASLILIKILNSAVTSVGTFEIVPVNGMYVQGQISGSKITGWANGITTNTFITDTSITGNTMAGLGGGLGNNGNAADIKFSQFYAADIPGRHRQWIRQ